MPTSWQNVILRQSSECYVTVSDPCVCQTFMGKIHNVPEFFSPSPGGKQIPVQIPLKFLHSGMSKRANPSFLENQWGQSSNNDLPQLVASIGANWREREKTGSFFLCVLRVNAACQKGDLLRPQRKTFPRWWKHDWATWVAQPNFCSTVTVITLGALWHPTSVKKTREKETRKKDAVWAQKGCDLGDPSSLSITHSQCCEWLQRPPDWDFDVAKSKRHIALPSIGKRTRKSHPHVEKYQQNGSIKATFKGAQSQRPDGIWLNGVYYVALQPQGPKQRWKLGLSFTFQEKGAHNCDSRGEIQCPWALIYHLDRHSIHRELPSEVKTH